jgi:hypothetical protein
MQFTGAVIKSNRGVRASVKADGDFVPPSGTAIPASRVSWTTSNAVNGVASNGTLSKTLYTQLYQGNDNAHVRQRRHCLATRGARRPASFRRARADIALEARVNSLTIVNAA